MRGPIFPSNRHPVLGEPAFRGEKVKTLPEEEEEQEGARLFEDKVEGVLVLGE